MASTEETKGSKAPQFDETTLRDGASTIGGSTLHDNSSLAPLSHPSEKPEHQRKKSWVQRMFHHDNKVSEEEGGGDSSKKPRRKSSIADSGPYIFAFGTSC